MMQQLHLQQKPGPEGGPWTRVFGPIFHQNSPERLQNLEPPPESQNRPVGSDGSQTIMAPPPCFTVGLRCSCWFPPTWFWSRRASPGPRRITASFNGFHLWITEVQTVQTRFLNSPGLPAGSSGALMMSFPRGVVLQDTRNLPDGLLKVQFLED